MNLPRWIVFGFLVLSACASAEPEDDSGETDQAQASDCSPSVPAELDWSLQGPTPAAADLEGIEQEENVLCTVEAITGPVAGGWSLSLSCAEPGGGSAVPYEVTFALSSSPFAAIDPQVEVELRYRYWAGFEVGNGTHLMLLQKGQAVVVASRETAEGGLSGHCAEATGHFRAQENLWLAAASASLEPSDCEDGSTFRLAAEHDSTPSYVYPGQEDDLGGGWRARVESARCSVQYQSGAEGWHVNLVVWRSSVASQ